MKKRNSIKSILLLTIISFVGVACVDEIKFGNAFLEKAPGEDVNEDVIFSKKVYTDYCYGSATRDFLLRLRIVMQVMDNLKPCPISCTLKRDGTLWGVSIIQVFCLPLTLTRAGWLPVRLTLHRGGWRI